MAQENNAVAAPDMPPAMAEIKKQTVEEVLADMNRMPLFMTTLDETDGEGGENPLLEAMKALAYEGTRYEVAENFRQQGNECARAKMWTDAKEFYDKALAALKGPQRKPDPDADAEGGKVIEVELDEEEEAKKEKVVEEASYVNRALCNLEKSELPASTRSFQSSTLLHMRERGGKEWMQILSIDRPSTMNNMHFTVSSLATSVYLHTHTDLPPRKLPLLHKRLRLHPPPQPLKRQSLLPLRQRLSLPRQAPRSPRRLRIRPQTRPLQRAPQSPLRKDLQTQRLHRQSRSRPQSTRGEGRL
jgi:hypothetical protein